MKVILRHILPFVALIALFGLGETPVFSSSVINQSVSTEWVAGKTCKVSKSINYVKCIRQSKTANHTCLFNADLFVRADLEQSIIISIQSGTFLGLRPMIILASGILFHRLAIEHHKISILKHEFLLSLCPVHGPVTAQPTLMWNSMFNEKWLSLTRKESSCSIDLSGQSGQPGAGFI